MKPEDQEKFDRYKAEHDERIKGQEFNKSVAERVFGLKVGFEADNTKMPWADDQELESRTYFIADEKGEKIEQMTPHPLLAPGYVPMFEYSESLTKFATWKVAEEMKKKGYLLRVNVQPDHVEVYFGREGTSMFYGLTRAADAGRAICESALKVISETKW